MTARLLASQRRQRRDRLHQFRRLEQLGAARQYPGDVPGHAVRGLQIGAVQRVYGRDPHQVGRVAEIGPEGRFDSLQGGIGAAPLGQVILVKADRGVDPLPGQGSNARMTGAGTVGASSGRECRVAIAFTGEA